MTRNLLFRSRVHREYRAREGGAADRSKTELFHLDGLAILGMIAELQTTDEVADYGMDLFGNETGAVLFGR